MNFFIFFKENKYPNKIRWLTFHKKKIFFGNIISKNDYFQNNKYKIPTLL